jgi:hypothetical protein
MDSVLRVWRTGIGFIAGAVIGGFVNMYIQFLGVNDAIEQVVGIKASPDFYFVCAVFVAIYVGAGCWTYRRQDRLPLSFTYVVGVTVLLLTVRKITTKPLPYQGYVALALFLCNVPTTALDELIEGPRWLVQTIGDTGDFVMRPRAILQWANFILCVCGTYIVLLS